MSSASKHLMSSPQGFQSPLLHDRERALSPSRAKISQLSEKLSNLQMQSEEDKSMKKETFEIKLKALDEKVVKGAQQDEAKFKLLREQLVKLQDSVSNEKVVRESHDDRTRTKDLKQTEGFL